MADYIVYDEHTLGYLIPEWDCGNSVAIGILRANVLRGAPFGWERDLGHTSVSASKVRPAVADDFKVYRVSLPPDFPLCSFTVFD